MQSACARSSSTPYRCACLAGISRARADWNLPRPAKKVTVSSLVSTSFLPSRFSLLLYSEHQLQHLFMFD